ncbi:MAG: SMP-30/gluconolactonase/LRE family protein [Pseudonocardiaceae bacterium]
MKFQNITVHPVSGEGPEDVLVDDQGSIYTGLADGRILRISETGDKIETIAETPGRSLGLEFYGDDELVVCASDHGLLAVTISTGAVRTLTDTVAGTALIACNNAAVAGDGTIYFSDSSQRYPIPEWRKDLIQQTRTGRLFRRSPDGTIDELLSGLHFANGVALAQDESFVTVVESGGYRVRRVWLAGPHAGSNDIFLDDIAGYPDNSSTGTDGLIWVAVPSQRVAAAAVVQRMPAPVRALVLRLPERLQPAPSRTVSVLGVNDDGHVVHSYQGEIEGFHMLTGVRERNGKLYFGSLLESSIAIADR